MHGKFRDWYYDYGRAAAATLLTNKVTPCESVHRLFLTKNMKSMSQQQSAFMKVGNQLATGRRVVNISDDPQACLAGSERAAVQSDDAANARRSCFSTE